ncbi:flagellin N-terminal helical domain-containing protein, partial [Veronia nyctiphanis]
MGGHIVNDFQGIMAHRHLDRTNRVHNETMDRLAAGTRIQSAKDDAAGLHISTRLTSQARGYDTSIRNLNDGLSLLQTADAAMEETNTILH